MKNHLSDAVVCIEVLGMSDGDGRVIVDGAQRALNGPDADAPADAAAR